MNISVLGCGRWGSFIGWYLNKIGHNVILWGREGSSHLMEIKSSRKNEYLHFDEKIKLTESITQAINFADVIIVSISSQSLRNFLSSLTPKYELKNKAIVLCMKGIEESTGKRLSEVTKECIPSAQKIAVWVGPGHVQDFAKGIPNCMVIDSDDNNLKQFLSEKFSSPLIRFYYGSDMIGTEIGAAAKNVMGIAAGFLDGMHYESLKGALMSRGTHEIAKLIKAMGGNVFSAYGLAHLGDYQATLFSKYSNNRKYGESLVLGATCNKLAEGVKTSHALVNLSQKYGIEIPICDAVYKAVNGIIPPKDAVAGLFLRKPKYEF